MTWDWEAHTHRRETGLIEASCAHGLGHPLPGSALWVAEGFAQSSVDRGDYETYEEALAAHEGAWSSHGCDGCCSGLTFPDYRDSLIFAHSIIRRARTRSSPNWGPRMIDHPSISKARHGRGPRTKRKALARRMAVEQARRADVAANRARRHSGDSDVYDVAIIHRPFLRPGDPGWSK